MTCLPPPSRTLINYWMGSIWIRQTAAKAINSLLSETVGVLVQSRLLEEVFIGRNSIFFNPGELNEYLTAESQHTWLLTSNFWVTDSVEGGKLRDDSLSDKCILGGSKTVAGAATAQFTQQRQEVTLTNLATIIKLPQYAFMTVSRKTGGIIMKNVFWTLYLVKSDGPSFSPHQLSPI